MVLLKVNDRVMAKWPGVNLWYEGTIVDLNDIQYQVKFADESRSEYVLKHREVKSWDTFNRSRSRSRGRSSSKGRSSGRPKKEEKVEKEKEATPIKDEVKVFSPVLNATLEPRAEIKRSTSPKKVSRLPVVDSFGIGPLTSTPTRQSLRIATMVETKNAVDGQVNNVNANKVVTEEAAPVKAGIGARLCGGVSCIGSCIKSGILKLIPSLATIKVAPAILMQLAFPLIINRMCTKNKCTVMEFPDIPTKLEYYYDLNAIGIVAGLLLVLLLLSLIPLGRKVNLPNGAVVRSNGVISVLISLALIPALMYFNVNVLVVYKLYQHFLATFAVLTVVLSLLLYIRAGYIPDDAKNPKGNSGLFLPDFFNGRELNPVILGIDVKFFIYRVLFVVMLLFNVIVVVKDLEANKGQYSPTLFVICIHQIFMAVDVLWFEDTLATTYEYKGKGCGFHVLNGCLMAPFVLTLFPRFVLNHRTELEWYFLSSIVALYLIGYTIFRGSQSQKHAFRTNPSDPALAHLESLPTSAGTRLLVSGWWGIVRHPNYLGFIFGMISGGLVCGINFGLPWVLVGIWIILILVRIFEVENACKKKYGTAWDSYTERVKYRLIPKVF